MKLMKIICATLIITLISAPFVFAKPHHRGPIFMGEILQVEKGVNDKIAKLVVEGYINDGEVYKNKIVVLLNEETKIKSGSEENAEKVEFKKADKVFIVFNEEMTKSNPSQGTAKMIKLTTNP